MQKFQLWVILLITLLLAGCITKPDPVPPPKIVVIKQQPKLYPVEYSEALEEVKLYPLDEPGVIGGLKREDVDAIRRNMLRTYRWALTNQTTLEEINKQALKSRDEKIIISSQKETDNGEPKEAPQVEVIETDEPIPLTKRIEDIIKYE